MTEIVWKRSDGNDILLPEIHALCSAATGAGRPFSKARFVMRAESSRVEFEGDKAIVDLAIQFLVGRDFGALIRICSGAIQSIETAAEEHTRFLLELLPQLGFQPVSIE